VSQSPLQAEGSKDYADAWRAINVLIRSDGTWSGRERNLCFLNRGDGTFEDISFTSGLDLDSDGRAFVPLDLDADGDQDLIIKNRNGRQLRAFRNDLRPGQTRHLTVRLKGGPSNRDGVGGRIWVATNQRTLMREIVSGSGYLSQRSRVARFGLQSGETVREIRVRWPSGTVQDFEDPPQAGLVAVMEGAPELRSVRQSNVTDSASEPAGASEPEASPGTWLAEPLPVPDFELRTLRNTGELVRLSELRGSTVLLNFWATWCPPCRRELAQFQDRLDDFRRLGVQILAVSVDEPSNSGAVKDFADSLGLGYEVLLADARTAESYSVLNERLFDRRRALAIPTSFLVNEDGRIIKVYRGEIDATAILNDIREGSGDALPFAGHWAVSEARRDFEELGAAFAERGLAAPARRMFDEALARGDRTPFVLNNLAGTLIADGESERGEALLREALAMEPSLADARVNLATLLAQRGEMAEAEELIERALETQPEDVQALSVLGSIRFSQGQLEAAEGLFRKAADGWPDDPRFRENLGAALASQGRFEAALREYETARDLGSEGAALYTNLGVLYLQTGQAEQGLDAFLKAVEADPGASGSHLNLARYHLQSGNAEQAMRSIERAKGLSPSDLGTLLLEIQTLATQGRIQEAREAAQDALRQHPSSTEAADLLDALR